MTEIVGIVCECGEFIIVKGKLKVIDGENYGEIFAHYCKGNPKESSIYARRLDKANIRIKILWARK